MMTRYNVTIPEQYFDDMSEEDMEELYGNLKHALRRVDCIVEEVEGDE